MHERYKHYDIGWKIKEGMALRPHQIETYKDLLLRHQRTLDASQAGTGKTYSHLAKLLRYVHQGIALDPQNCALNWGHTVNGMIIAPRSPLLTWKDAIQQFRFSYQIRFFSYEGPLRERKKIREEVESWIEERRARAILLISWGLFSSPDFFNDLSWLVLRFQPHHIIADEAHYVFGESSRSDNFAKLWQRLLFECQIYPFVNFLTATPIHGGIHKAWPFFYCTFQNFQGFNQVFKNGLREFQETFFHKVTYINNRTFYGRHLNKDKFKALFNRNTVAHKRSKVIHGRKEPIFINTYYELPADKFRIYSTYLKLLLSKLKSPQKLSDINSLVKSLRERQLLTCPEIFGLPEEKLRVKVLFDLLNDLEITNKKTSDKVIIVFEFIPVFKKLMLEMKKKKLYTSGVIGALSTKAREKEIDNFNSRNNVLLIQRQVAEGLNLQKANIVINYELSYWADKYDQACGRIDRLGQTKEMYIFNILARRSVDITILKALYAKLSIAAEVTGTTLIPKEYKIKQTHRKVLEKLVEKELKYENA